MTDIPDSLYRESMQLNREVEREFAQNDSGRPICVWSVSGKVCQDTVVSDYPFLRKVVTKNA